MGTVLKWLALGICAVVLAAVVYLGGRIAYERNAAPERVDAILARSDPAQAIRAERLDMLIRVEDPTFWQNDGIDLKSPGAGMTTISQALGKRIFFKSFEPGPLKLRKIELIALTKFALVPTVEKRDILRASVAAAYLGRGDEGPVIGFAEGAQVWYGKDIGALTDKEFLGLVAMLPAPNRLDPKRHPRENAERVARIERLLAGQCAPQGRDDVELAGCAA